MKKIILTLEELTTESFSQFGQVISCDNKDHLIINDGYAKKYPDLAEIDTQEDGGRTAVNIFIAKKRLLPLKIEMLEKHPDLKAEFLQKLGADPEFAKSPALRLDFFYRRHPSYDTRLNLYPILRSPEVLP